jgi:hypothetical protein
LKPLCGNLFEKLQTHILFFVTGLDSLVIVLFHSLQVEFHCGRVLRNSSLIPGFFYPDIQNLPQLDQFLFTNSLIEMAVLKPLCLI